MQKFHFKALSANGEQIEGSLEAADEKSVIHDLQAKGYYPISATLEKNTFKSNLLTALQQKDNTRLSRKDLLNLTHNLATLLTSGLPLDKAFQLLLKNQGNIKASSTLNAIYNEIKSGNSLSASLSRFPQSFDSLYIAMVKAGEASGDLGEAFLNLTAHLEKKQKLQSEIVSSLTYPILLLGMSVLSLFLLLIFVIPRFIPMFQGTEQALPLLSRIIFSLSAFTNQYWWLVIIVTFMIFYFSYSAFQYLIINNSSHSALLKFPFFGQVIRTFETAKFTRSSATLLNNGLSLVDAMTLAAESVRLQSLSDEIRRAITGVKEGRRISDTLQNSEILAPLVIDLLKVGEESGKVSEMLAKIAQTSEQETDEKIKRMLTILEPVLILGLGLIISLIILSVLLAMLSLNDIII